jgi:hypothetical protein
MESFDIFWRLSSSTIQNDGLFGPEKDKSIEGAPLKA